MRVSVSRRIYSTLQLERKGRTPRCLRTNIQGSTKVPGRSCWVCFVPATGANLLPLENQLHQRIPLSSPRVYKAFCLFVRSFPFSFSNAWLWWMVGRSPGTPGHPQRGDGIFLNALTLGSPMGTVHGPRHNRSQLQSHLPVLS